MRDTALEYPETQKGTKAVRAAVGNKPHVGAAPCSNSGWLMASRTGVIAAETLQERSRVSRQHRQRMNKRTRPLT